MTDEEIAEFWDTHSLADYWDQLEEVEIEVKLKSSPTEIVSLQLERSDAQLIKKIAKKLRIEYSALLRGWIKDKLQEVAGGK